MSLAEYVQDPSSRIDDDVIDLTKAPAVPANPFRSSSVLANARLTADHAAPSQAGNAEGRSRAARKPSRHWEFSDDESDTDIDLLLGLPATGNPSGIPSSSQSARPVSKSIPEKRDPRAREATSLLTSDIDSSQISTSYPPMSSDDELDLSFSQSQNSAGKGKSSATYPAAKSVASSLKRPRALDEVNLISSDLGGTDNEAPAPKPKRQKAKTEEELRAAEAAKLEKQRLREEAKKTREEAKLLKQQERKRLKVNVKACYS